MLQDYLKGTWRILNLSNSEMYFYTNFMLNGRDIS